MARADDFTPPRPWISSYADGVPDDIELPKTSLSDLITDSAAEWPDNVALEFFGRETTYAELADQIARAAEGLRRLGVRKGDIVALVLPNCPQHVVAFYAALRLGAIVVEHNPLYTPRELRHQFEDHEARIVIAWDKVVATIQEFPKDVRPEHIVSVNMIEAMERALRDREIKAGIRQLAHVFPAPMLQHEQDLRAQHLGVHHAAVEQHRRWERDATRFVLRDLS